MAIKNQPLTVHFEVWDTTNNVGLSGDSDNITTYVIKDNSDPVQTTTSATEISASVLAGWYKVSLTSDEMNADSVLLVGKSSTSAASVRGIEILTYTNPISANTIQINGESVVQSSAFDWTDTEKAQFRYALGLSGTTSATLSTGELQLTKAATDQLSFSANSVLAYTTNATTIDDSAVSAACLSAINSQFEFSGTSVLSYSTNSVSVDTSAIAAAVSEDIFDVMIDGKSFEDLLKILLSNSIGKIVRTNNQFQYHAQDGTTILFTLRATAATREEI